MSRLRILRNVNEIGVTLKYRLALRVASTILLSQKMTTESGFASKVFPAEKKQKLQPQFSYGGGKF